MAGKVSAVPFGGDKKNRGTFHVKGFNFFAREDTAEYETLRTRNADPSSGVVIENVREFTRKVTVREGQGENQVVTTSEDLYMIVQWWEKSVSPPRGEADDAEKPKPDEKPEWSLERPAQKPDAN